MGYNIYMKPKVVILDLRNVEERVEAQELLADGWGQLPSIEYFMVLVKAPNKKIVTPGGK